jgi:SAM-dependent methyltransferase
MVAPDTSTARNILSPFRARFAWWIKRGSGIIFDRLHRVDTGGGVAVKNLEIASANRDKGIAYDPCPWSTLRRALSLIPLQAEGFTFVDIGCGKGKVLLSAMVLPFRRIVGVEFSSYLTKVAEQNIASARFITRKCPHVEVICADAVQYPTPDEPIVFFFANPFKFEIMGLVLDNIVSSYLKNPRPIFLMFYATSSMIPQISEFLPRKSSGRARLRASGLLGERSINIFELPQDQIHPG